MSAYNNSGQPIIVSYSPSSLRGRRLSSRLASSSTLDPTTCTSTVSSMSGSKDQDIYHIVCTPGGCLKIKSIILDHLSHPGEIRVGRSKRASPTPVSERNSLAPLMWLTWQNESQDTVKDFVLVPYPLEELPLTGRIH